MESVRENSGRGQDRGIVKGVVGPVYSKGEGLVKYLGFSGIVGGAVGFALGPLGAIAGAGIGKYLSEKENRREVKDYVKGGFRNIGTATKGTLEMYADAKKFEELDNLASYERENEGFSNHLATIYRHARDYQDLKNKANRYNQITNTSGATPESIYEIFYEEERREEELKRVKERDLFKLEGKLAKLEENLGIQGLGLSLNEDVGGDGKFDRSKLSRRKAKQYNDLARKYNSSSYELYFEEFPGRLFSEIKLPEKQSWKDYVVEKGSIVGGKLFQIPKIVRNYFNRENGDFGTGEDSLRDSWQESCSKQREDGEIANKVLFDILSMELDPKFSDLSDNSNND
jgi:hypothetical protein